ncbi:hypothetical protein [Limnobacter sp.]|uniref:hypothetical protein n=1 Tax=Limnobacter sp. TaxID=2003368 RepID=UPI002586E87D|nr:hypothetical protein [Limnobacter sp.]
MQGNNSTEGLSDQGVDRGQAARSNPLGTEAQRLPDLLGHAAHDLIQAVDHQPLQSASRAAVSSVYTASPESLVTSSRSVQQTTVIPAEAVQVMQTILPVLVDFVKTAYRVADMPNPDFDPQATVPVSRYLFRESTRFTDKPSHAGLAALRQQGISAQFALHQPGFWRAMVQSIEGIPLHSIKCLNAAALIGEKIRSSQAGENVHVYQAGIKDADHHIVVVTSTPIACTPGDVVSADSLPADAVIVDAWTHFLREDSKIEVLPQLGRVGQEVVRYALGATPCDSITSFLATGMLSSVRNNDLVAIESPGSGFQTTQLSLFCELPPFVHHDEGAAHPTELLDDVSEYTEVAFEPDDASMNTLERTESEAESSLTPEVLDSAVIISEQGHLRTPLDKMD